ncbi:hypothetical protein E6Q11_05600 [Candidatus Dojkabacteria bacterium]|uniref:Uncharacterized protein n=1 Tax=Candidatus Dojkabacteria bacterium TaxID=2099670 RepID=A0A5C7J3D9_9BACT|nr:MAG: hypothetical protein E6Q11_05600 [Candidatus Dojkabacteria bacterium]
MAIDITSNSYWDVGGGIPYGPEYARLVWSTDKWVLVGSEISGTAGLLLEPKLSEFWVSRYDLYVSYFVVRKTITPMDIYAEAAALSVYKPSLGYPEYIYDPEPYKYGNIIQSTFRPHCRVEDIRGVYFAPSYPNPGMTQNLVYIEMTTKGGADDIDRWTDKVKTEEY